MRPAGLLLTALLCAAAPAQAQVTVDLQALDALPGAGHAAKPHPPPRPAHRRIAVTRKPARPPPQPATEQPSNAPPAATTATAAPAASPPPPAPPPATLPTAPPATVALAPIPPPPPPTVEPVAPPPPPPVSDTAASAATSTGAGLRVTFGAGETDLSPASAAAIKGLVQSAPTGDTTSFEVVAYAAGTPEDPSTARRLSLSRALAVRSALMAEGIGSARIYVRALGATGGDAAPDRVDLAVMGGNTPAASPVSAPAPDARTKSQSP